MIRFTVNRRVLVLAALALLLAVPSGSMAVAALAAPPPVMKEQAGLVVEPGGYTQLSMQLTAGQALTGHVSVVPQGSYFSIEGPDGTAVLNAGTVTERDFSFVAATSGSYQFRFFNSLDRIANRVVILQVQHTGGALLPYSGGIYAAVKAGEVNTVPLTLDANLSMNGFFTVQGGNRDLVFSATYPSGGSAISPAATYKSQAFSFTTTQAGQYKLLFDNSLSSIDSKLVYLQLTTSPGGQWWWGTATRLAFTTPPASAIAGSTFEIEPVVTVMDDSGNTATNSFATITLRLTPGTGTPGAALSGVVTVDATGGSAVFHGLSVDLAGSGYTLTATSSGLASATSAVFKVAPVIPPNCVALKAGWNLISLPVVPRDTAISQVLAGIAPNVLSVWHYDAVTANWTSYVPDLGGSLDAMSDGKAYWVNMKEAVLLTIDTGELTKPAARREYPVVPGWNMVGLKATLPRAAAAYLTGTSYRPFPIYGYSSSTPFALDADKDKLQPGSGYWIYFNAPGAVKP